MPIALNPTFYDPGAGGVPTTTNPIPMGGRADDYEHSITAEVGFDSMRTSFLARSMEEAADWCNRLISSCVVFDPEGGTAWEGFLAEVEIAWGNKKVAVSLADVANKVRVKYNSDSGAQTSTTSVTSTASIARFGTKERAINFSTANATAAANRANVVLGQIAWPRSKRSSSAASGNGRGGIRVTLTCRGWWYAFDWLLTSSTSTATTSTTTQVANLIAAYNAINAFFSSSTANIISSGVSDTEKIEDETSYEEQIAKLLASGTGTQRLVWGMYEGRALTVAVWAGATPSTITYYESDRDQTVRDAWGNVVPPWRLRPDAMAQLTDLTEPAPGTGPIDTLTRRYIKRVSCRITSSGVSGELEADDVDSLEAILTQPTGGTSTGVSDRQNKVERKIARPARTRFSGTNGTVDVGGGSVSNTGGGAVDLGTGSGIGGAGSSGVTTSGGTSGRVAEWSGSSTLQAATLIKSGAGVLTLSSSGAFTLTVPATGTATLGTGTSGRVAEWSGTNTVQASTLIKSGAGVLTLSASTTETITIGSGGGGTIDLNGGVLTLGPDLTTSGAGAGLTLSSSGTFTLTIPATGTAALGTGSAGALAKWSTTNTLTTATAGTDYAAAAHTHAAADIVSGTMATARLGSGTASATTLLHGDSTWSQVDLTAEVTGILPVANGGTGVSTGAVSGAGTSGGVAYYTSGSTITGGTVLTFNDSTNVLSNNGSIVAADNSAFGSLTKPTSTRVLTKGSGTTSSSKSLQAQDGAATEHMYVRDDGQLGARVAWTIFSDRRLKRNIRDVEPALARNALKVILDLPDPVLFDYLQGATDQIGYLADEVQSVLPQIVQPITVEGQQPQTPSDLLGVQYSNLIPIILLGLKQLIALVPGAQARANLPPGPNRPR